MDAPATGRGVGSWRHLLHCQSDNGALSYVEQANCAVGLSVDVPAASRPRVVGSCRWPSNYSSLTRFVGNAAMQIPREYPS